MKHLPLVFFMLILGLAVPARAFETPPLSVENRKAVINVGTSFRVIPHRFGCADFVWGTISSDGRVVALKYIPVGDDFEKWTRMMSITVYGLPEGRRESEKAMESLREKIQKDIEKTAHIITAKAFTSVQDDPALYLEYETGAGAAYEQNAAVLMRSAKNGAAFIQLQVRGDKKLDPADAADIRDLPDLMKPKKK
jgi:hypothetical protein